MDTTRQRETRQLTLIFLAAMLLRMLLGRVFNAPSIFTDEFQYVEMARALPLGKGLYWDSVNAQFPCWLYTLMIAPLINLLSWDSAYSAIRGLNAMLVASTVFPAYGLTRELAGHRHALGAALLVALLTGAGYTPMVMTENLFLPVFTLAIWAIFRAVMAPTAWRRLAAGLACGLAFHVKPHAMLLPLIAAATVLIFEADRLRDQADPKRGRLRQYLAGVGRHWLTALGWAIAVSPRIYIMLRIEHFPTSPFIDFLKGTLGSYSGLAAGRQDYSSLAMAGSLGRYLLAWGWSAGLLPAWFLIYKLFTWTAKRETPATRLLAILATVSTAGMLLLVARHTLVTNAMWIMHERYYFIVLPALLCLFCARVEPVRWVADGRWLLAPMVIGSLWKFFPWLFETLKWNMPTSAPSFTGIMLFERPEMVGYFLIGLYLLLLLAALGMYFIKPGDFKRQFTIVALFFAAYNLGWYGFHGQVLSAWRKDDVILAKKIDRATKNEADQVIVLKDGLTRAQTWHFGIRNPGVGVYLNPKLLTWWETPLAVAPDGQIRSPYPLENSWLAAANNWKFNRKPEKSFDDCSLYYLGGKQPLRMDAAQLAAYRDDTISSAALFNGNEYLKGLRLTALARQIPTSMTVGQRAKVLVKLRNDSPFTLPGGKMRIGIGYHWSDPRRTGSYQAIVFDDNQYTRLPEWVEPGQVIETSIGVRPPAQPGDEYLLTIKPLLTVGSGKSRVKTWSKGILFHETVKVLGGTAKTAPKVAAGNAPTTRTATVSR